MYRLLILLALVAGQALLQVSPDEVQALSPPISVQPQNIEQLEACKDLAWSSEEDFITQGPLPPDGDPIISDGDLLSRSGDVCMRNADLVLPFDVPYPMGLDAADVLEVADGLVAFSTELNSPFGNFTHGDLLTTWGAAIPNQALLFTFQVSGDRGLDAVHFVGDLEAIIDFNTFAMNVSRSAWLSDPSMLAAELQERGIDIWFSIEGTHDATGPDQLLDGDVLSAATGTIIADNSVLLPASVPAGIPGIDYGLDALTTTREGDRPEIRFSIEILFRDEPPFTDGDVIKLGNGVEIPDTVLPTPFEPKADFVGLDALHMTLEGPALRLYLPAILKVWGLFGLDGDALFRNALDVR
jgi:hypothetical protein